MGTFLITGPDGKKYRITGDTPEGAMQALQEAMGGSVTAAPADQRDSLVGKIDAFGRGAADIFSIGLADEIAAGGDALFNPLLGTGEDGASIGERYDKNLAAQRGVDASDTENRFGYRLAGQIGGGLAQGVGLLRKGLSFAGQAAAAGEPLKRIAAGSAADAAILSGAHGFGSGEGLQDRAIRTGVDGLIGLGMGAAMPFAVAGAGAGLKSIGAPFLAWARPNAYADDAMATAMRRSKMTPEDIQRSLQSATDDGQPVFSVADALGLNGQRLASTVARNPGDERQAFVEMLDARQAGQGRRISSDLAEAFDAPDTAAARTAQMTKLRDELANRMYESARKDAGPVDLSDTIKAIDEVLTPGVHSMARPNNQIAHDSIEGALSRVRSMITDGRSNLTDFNAVFRAKLDLDDMITKAEGQGAGNRAHYLSNVQRKLDGALAKASKTYAGARDQFAADSRAIEAIAVGRNAAQRGRSEDTIPAFRNMNVDEQYGFRGGYADPLIESVQGAAPGVNKARPLMNDATQAEFPVFAAPGKADQLQRQLDREMTMFATRNAATGGSKTLDNTADSADLANYDPSILMNLLSGRPTAAAMSAIGRSLNGLKGQPPSVTNLIARILMETDPDIARKALQPSAARTAAEAKRRAVTLSIINSLMGAGTGRLVPTP